MKSDGYSTLTDAELWSYHAYDYGWRQLFVGGNVTSSPIDPTGRWFSPGGAHQVELMFIAECSKRAEPRITPAEQAAARGDYEQAARFRAQDRARAQAMAKIEGTGKLSNGAFSAESKAFSALCVAQVRANMHWDERGPPQTIHDVQNALGVRANATDEAAE